MNEFNYELANNNNETILNKNPSSIKNKDKKYMLIIFYFIIFIIIVTFLLINLIATKDSFDPKNLKYLSPTDICRKYSDLLNICMDKYKDKSDIYSNQFAIDNCLSYSLSVQSCYDSVINFNKKCTIYFSVLLKCMKNYENENDNNSIKVNCMECYLNLKRCNTFDHLFIEADKIFGNEITNLPKENNINNTNR
jgi:hypothetical protein